MPLVWNVKRKNAQIPIHWRKKIAVSAVTPREGWEDKKNSLAQIRKREHSQVLTRKCPKFFEKNKCKYDEQGSSYRQRPCEKLWVTQRRGKKWPIMHVIIRTVSISAAILMMVAGANRCWRERNFLSLKNSRKLKVSNQRLLQSSVAAAVHNPVRAVQTYSRWRSFSGFSDPRVQKPNGLRIFTRAAWFLWCCGALSWLRCQPRRRVHGFRILARRIGLLHCDRGVSLGCFKRKKLWRENPHWSGADWREQDRSWNRRLRCSGEGKTFSHSGLCRVWKIDAVVSLTLRGE